MPGVRVYQLAKELKVQSALILELLDRLGKDVHSDLSSIDEPTAHLVRERLTTALANEKKRLLEEQGPAVPVTAAELPAPVVEAAAAVQVEAPPAEALPEAPAAPVEPVPQTSVPGPIVETPSEAEPSPAASAAAPPVAVAPAAVAAPAAAHPPATPGPGDPRRPRLFAAKRLVPKLVPTKPVARPPVGRPTLGPPRSFEPPRPGTAPPRTTTPPPSATTARPPAPGRATSSADREARRARIKGMEAPPPPSKPKPDLPPVPATIQLSEAVTVKELAEKLNRKSKDVIAKLLTKGVFANINQPLDPQMAIDLAKEFGSDASIVTFEDEQRQDALPGIETAQVAAPTSARPPVVTVMGHVDHGKTSLLDAIREANVVSSEHGGITQHIGAYQVEERGRKITFLDTPGHEAFTLMRARGARVTDIVVLVVAADDGVKPQTVEAIDHAKAAGVPIVVAINKVDKPDARPDRVKQQLADRDLLVEEYGGKIVACEISAKKRQGIEELLEMILLVADLADLKAAADKPGTGVVLEAKLDRARGIVATVLVQSGTLRVGDPFIAGSAFGKVRAMADEHGRRVDEAGPSTPVEVMGFASEPTAGDLFQGVADEWKARQIAALRQEKQRVAALAKSSRRTLESLSREIAEGEIKELSVLIKADVQGSLEALQKAVSEIPSEKIRVGILRASTGAISQADVLLAAASNAIIVGFNVRPDRATADLARNEEVEIRLYNVIYDVVNDIKQAMIGLLEPTTKETVLGQAEVRQLFRVPKAGVIAGCMVTDGTVKRSAEVRLIRDNVVIYGGRVGSLRRFKDDVSEVKSGFECGIGIANFNDLKEGDVIEFFVVEKVAVQTL
ncbi:MAG TPA: translation initiation factor IF-2 [Candidatus Polarisedimenticolaceae bacterium]|nr:translation initiation factor IF-2 [Candidatus Polarisedimenticolaceae bacterium]